MAVEVMNKHLVASQGDFLRIMRMPAYGIISKEDALNLAAWLVAMADDNDEFPELLKAVQNT